MDKDNRRSLINVVSRNAETPAGSVPQTIVPGIFTSGRAFAPIRHDTDDDCWTVTTGMMTTMMIGGNERPGHRREKAFFVPATSRDGLKRFRETEAGSINGRRGFSLVFCGAAVIGDEIKASDSISRRSAPRLLAPLARAPCAQSTGPWGSAIVEVAADGAWNVLLPEWLGQLTQCCRQILEFFDKFWNWVLLCEIVEGLVLIFDILKGNVGIVEFLLEDL